MNINEQIKELEKEFNDLHLKCVEETKEYGRATYKTHGFRCQALAKLELLKKLQKELSEEIDNVGFRTEEVEETKRVLKLRIGV